MQRFVDSLYHSSSLSCSGRAVHYSHVFSMKHFIYRSVLRSVEPRKTDGLKGESRRRLSAMKYIAQLCQAIVLGTDYLIHRLEHKSIAGLVEIQLHAKFISTLQSHQSIGAGQYHHHAVVFYIVYCSHEIKIVQLASGQSREETYRTTVFKEMFYILIFATLYLYHELIERIVIATPQTDRIPTHATLYLAPYAHHFSLLLELLLLVIVLHLKQFILMLKIKYRRFYSVSIPFHCTLLLFFSLHFMVQR